MSHKIAFLVAIACVLALSSGEDVKIPPQPPASTTSTIAPKTTTTATTTTTTTEPTTTSTTTEPTTTSPKTTTTSTTTTSTAAPTTTSTPAPPTPSTPAPPTPAPVAQVGNWTVYDDSENVTCIIAVMAIQLNVSYDTVENKTGYASLIVPANTTTAKGSCGNVTQTLVLSWVPEGVVNQSHIITLTFMKNDTTKLIKLGRIDLVIQANVTEFPGIAIFTKMILKNNQSEFSTSLGTSYSCTKIQTLNLTKAGNNATKGSFSVSHLHVESFHTTHDATFSSAKDCESSSSPDIVPIAVGCALVGLVAIVLIAYLVGRRRSQARGYLSIDENGSR